MELQKYAVRIVSQCVSSSGCERNWSTFALIHTKVRNRLGYEKLRKLVYVRHNLKQRLKHDLKGKKQTEEKEVDPCTMLIDATLFDESNPIMDWLNEPRMEDEDLTLEEMLSRSTKRKILSLRRAKKGKGKRAVVDEEDEFIEAENDTDENSPVGSPAYDESNDSSSAGDTDDNHGEDNDEPGDASPPQQQSEEEEEDANKRSKRPRKKKREEGFVY